MSELLGANTEVQERHSESLSADARRVQDIRVLAQRAVAELQASWDGSDLVQLTQQWEQQTSPMLAGASASLDTCAAQLRAQSAAQRAASSSYGGSLGSIPRTGSQPQAEPPMLTTPPEPPPQRGTPDANATWWKSLSAQQQRQVITAHPDWIGNRDGVAFTARDQANRILLTVDRSRLEADRSRILSALAGNWSRGAMATASTALDRIDDKLVSLDAIDATLSKTHDRQLLLLDLGPEKAQAAIAVGNVDTADNVAVFVPGMSASVTESMKGFDQNMSQLRRRAEAQSGQATPTQAFTTAAVAWIGYQTPGLGWDLLSPNDSVAAENLAMKGAARLTPFLRGIGAARYHDAHLTLLGHSYGSTTAGLALTQHTGVDDVVFFGSPGLGTSHLHDLKLPAGHEYYIEAQWDAVGDFGVFGIDPSHLDGIKHASARESTVVEPGTGEIRHLKGITGHTSYLDDSTTSQYNMSVVVAGVPGRVVYDRGEDIGDVLSWPVPGTYP